MPVRSCRLAFFTALLALVAILGTGAWPGVSAAALEPEDRVSGPSHAARTSPRAAAPLVACLPSALLAALPPVPVRSAHPVAPRRPAPATTDPRPVGARAPPRA